MNKFKKLLQYVVVATILVASLQYASAHNSNQPHTKLKKWEIAAKKSILANLLMMKDDIVYLEKHNSEIIKVPLSDLNSNDQKYVKDKYAVIATLNKPKNVILATKQNETFKTLSIIKVGLFATILILSLVLLALISRRYNSKLVFYLPSFAMFALLFGFKDKIPNKLLTTTNPLQIDSAFAPFKPNVNTRWDDKYFYVESKGIPTTHEMMKGITGWQQQVPIPQCYIGNNAWSVPLNPVVAATPIPVNADHFSRGAIAIAVNGVSIFNPYTNTGVDAYLDGQLDQWGGHCGRADDYHYHIAPLHLYGTTQKTLPIAYAFDGFAIYGAYEPEGTSMTALDANHGHFGANGVYHYHGSDNAPYMIANMVGQVTEDNTKQLIPQAQASPIRPALTPLKGAVITGCLPVGNNGYNLSYTLGGQTYKVNYSWTANGSYTFNYISPSSSSQTNYKGFSQCSLPTSIENEDEFLTGLKVFPNPSRNKINLSFVGKQEINENIQIALYNSLGQLVYTSNVFQESINSSKFAKGCYELIVRVNDKLYSQKIVVE